MKSRSPFYQVTELTNNLENFVPVGCLYLYDLPRLPANGIESPDGWKWLELPYNINAPISSRKNCYLSNVLVDLSYLIVRGYARATYKIINTKNQFSMAIVRLYLFPSDHDQIRTLTNFRATYFRKGANQPFHITIIRRLLMALDYSNKSWNIGDTENKIDELVNALRANHGLGLSALEYSEIPLNRYISTGPYIPLPDDMTENELYMFHIQRLANGQPYSPYVYSSDSDDVRLGLGKDRETRLQERLLGIYNSIQSPSLNNHIPDEDFQELLSDILNDDIPGFKSDLYSYQRNSVAKMLEHELFTRTALQPNIIKIQNAIDPSRDHYFNLETSETLLNPETYTTPRGGILAENMGFGKTCICLALICISKNQVSQIPKEHDTYVSHSSVKSLLDNCVHFINRKALPWKSYSDQLPPSCVRLLESNPGSYEVFELDEKLLSSYNTRKTVKYQTSNSFKMEFSRTLLLASSSLVVVPDNLWHQWKIEIKKHVQKDFLKVLDIPNIKYELPEPTEIIKYDIVLMSLSSFSRQSESKSSPLRQIHWKRLIIDEGHSMNSKGSRAVSLASELYVERKWAITGTPTAGLTNLHMNEEIEQESRSNTPKLEEYTVKRKFSTKDDLTKLGIIVSNFLKIEPWCHQPKLWSQKVVKPFLMNSFNSDSQLADILKSIIVRHSLIDIEDDIELPPLHHKAVFLEPSFFDKLSINLFIAVLATNAVTSERTDKDYMFHPSNKHELRRLITNLQRATFYWTGFAVSDIEALLSICENALKESQFPEDDMTLIKKSVFMAKTALSNSRWRTMTAIHEMNYYVSDLPIQFQRSLSTGIYPNETDSLGNLIGVYGAPQIHSVQKFFFKNRLIKTSDVLKERLLEHSKSFWKNYWKMTEQKNIQRLKRQDGQNIDTDVVKEVVEMDVNPEKGPAWIDSFDPISEEKTILWNSTSKAIYSQNFEKTHKRSSSSGESGSNGGSHITAINKRKKTLQNSLEELSIESEESGIRQSEYKARVPGRSTPVTPDPIGIPDQDLSSTLRKAKLLGTASVKLSYLAARLMEHQVDGIKSIVFFEFEDSAYYLTELLDILGLNYIMYATFIKQNERSANLAKFGSWNVNAELGGVTLIMDLKLASHGLTIISATRVYFINPVWKKTVEAQAIKRAHRIGQKNEVFVETLILKNTIEEEMYKKRSEVTDSKEENNTLIDDTGMQEYIMRYEFLPMFNGRQQSEYEQIRSPAKNEQTLLGLYNNQQGDHHFLSVNSDSSDDDGIRLFEPLGRIGPGTKIRTWTIPLFTESSLSKINEVESKMKETKLDLRQSNRDRSFDIINIDKEDIDEQDRKSQEELQRARRLELTNTLRMMRKRKVKFG